MARLSTPRFTGRERELAALTEAVGEPAAVVLIEGEAGIGKTRLVREFLSSPPGRKQRSLVVHCPPFRQPCTLGPVADALRQSTADVSGLGLSALAGALRPLFPEWAEGLPPLPQPLEDASAARYRLYRALAELLACLRVQALVAEDAHWADEATLEFLLFLASRQPQALHLVVTCRPEDTTDGSLLRRLSRLAGLRLALPPLDVNQTASLVSSMLAGGSVTAEFAAFLHERTEGLPLAVEETVRLMGDRADLAVRHGAWARRHLADIEVPPTVRDAVLDRTTQLAPEALAVLRAAAVLGEPAAEPVVTAVAGLAGEPAYTGLAEALSSGLLVENSFPYGHSLVFRHALAARAVYDAIPARQRRHLHARSASVLEDQRPLPVAQLARHFRKAADPAKWCKYAEQAAGQALSVGDQPTAAVLLQDLVNEADLPVRVVLRLVQQIPPSALPGYGPLTRLIRRLRSLVNDAGLSPTERAEIGFQLGRLLMSADEYEASVAELERALPGLTHRPADAARAMILLGWPRQTLWPAAAHQRWLERGWSVAQEAAIPDDDRLVLAVNRAIALLQIGEEAGWAVEDELPADPANPRQALQVASTLMNMGDAATHWGRYDDAQRQTCAALELADRHDFPRLRDGLMVQQAYLDWLTGAWRGLAERIETLTGHEEPQTRLDALLISGLFDAAAGASVAAGEKLCLVLAEARRRGMAEVALEPAVALARLRVAEGAADEALALTDEPLEVITTKGIWLWATATVPVRVQALATMGRTEEAEALVMTFAQGLRGREWPAPAAALVLGRALLAEAFGEHRRAAVEFGRAAAAWQRLPRPYDALLAEERQAHCLLALGQDKEGFDLLSQVLRGLSALGARGDADRVMKALHAHGITATTGRPGRRSYGDQLSPRELEVLRLFAAGHTVRQIADALFLSPKTVDSHVDSARRKLHAPSRAAMATIAAERGVLPSAAPAKK